LPHGLVEAFHSTLEEVRLADVLINVADASDLHIDAHITTTIQVLNEIGANEIPRILVLNKIDLVDADTRASLISRYPESIAVSAKTGEGLSYLVRTIQDALTHDMYTMLLRIPHENYNLVALVHREGIVLNEIKDESATLLYCRVPSRLQIELKPLCVENAASIVALTGQDDNL